VEMVRPYYVLRHLAGPAGSKPLMVEAINFQDAMRAACGISANRVLPDNKTALRACVATAYTRQRAIWLARLSGAASQEATRPLEQHIALQARLQALGFLSLSEKIDGIYGTATRTAIIDWQVTMSITPTGVLGDSDAALLSRKEARPATGVIGFGGR
jgi:hypothetical protein